MAPRGPANKPRDYDYSNVGKAGRRTGITLKEGKLDEHGMEELDGMFSSPEKSPAKNGYGNNDTILNSEDMEMGNSSIPDPAEVLSGRRGQWGSYAPPPRSRSPIKSHMNGTPRRTPGLRSSPIPHGNQSSSPTSSRAAAKRTLDFSRSPALGKSPLGNTRATSSSPRPIGIQDKGKGKATINEAEDTAVYSDDEDHSSEDNEVDGIIEDDDPELGAQDQGLEEEEGGEEEDASSQPGTPDREESPVENGDQSDVSPSLTAEGSTRGKKRKLPSPAPEESAPGRRKAKTRAPAQDSNPEPNPGPSHKRRGRPAKGSQPENHRDEEDDGQGSRPAKKPKTSRPKSQKGNLQMSAQQEKELDKVVENINNRNGPLKGRSLYILRKEVPSQEGTLHTRSGRASVRPLAYWRNERCVYGDGEAEVGERFPLSTIKEIIRTEELEPDRTRPTKRKTSKKTKAQKNQDDESEDENMDNADPWEKDTGILHGYIRKWDPDLHSAIDEEEILDIAYAPSAIETREVKGATFRFAKLLSTSFIGSGVVEMPPGGVKKPKNSKKMHMVFFVYRGRVQVDISGVQFSVGKGGVFQVPRGNSYSFANAYEKPASLFFTQGCVPTDTDGSANAGESGGGGEPAPTSAPEPTSTPAPPEKAPPASKKASTRGTGKGRGRGRGRGK
ncbi:hypothetical protein FQN54_005820 [Arachnomyces sp. PD_36]|nr:hypothetical protein FQN54_005820 [Arachnomyces sp. PD_36]